MIEKKRDHYISKIDMIAKESFNNEQKELAKKIIRNANEQDIDSIYQLIIQRVKTGFVFDAAPEVNHDCVAIIRENSNMYIDSETVSTNFIEHKLIIGENYDALKNLLITHRDPKTGEGLIDIIYIDPPYGTEKAREDGNDYKEEIEASKFVYRDKFTRDGWLNMMNERLKLSKKLLKDDGVIFVSIDDNNQAYLKVLMDEIFGEINFIANLPTIMNLKGNQDQFGFAGTHEYTLVYTKNIMNKKNSKNSSFDFFNLNDEELDEWDIDEIGYYKLGATLKRTGSDAPREKRPTTYFPILINKNNQVEVITLEEYEKIYDKSTGEFDDRHIENLKEKYESKGYKFILPLQQDGKKTSWRWGYQTFINDNHEIIVTDNYSLYKKQRPALDDIPSKKPKTLFYKPEYSTTTGTETLKKIGLTFPNPKPVDLIKDFIKIGTSNKNAVILDFFAGSGTTGQAIMELNYEDGGSRQAILVTNNENNIGIGTTRERLYRIIKGIGSNNKKIKWEYRNNEKKLNNNKVRVFEIQYHQLTINDFDKAKKLITESEKQFKLLNENFKTKDKFDIYNELSSLNPLTKEKI